MHHEQKINSHPWSQFLNKESTGHHTGKTEDCKRDGYPNLEGWSGTENRQHDNKNAVWEEVIAHFIHQSGCFVQTEIIRE